MAKAKSSLAKAELEAVALSGEKAATTPKGQVESFYTNPDGTAYATKEDLDKDYSNSFMMRSDYTQKTQVLAEDRKRIEQRERDLASRESNAQRLETDYKRFDSFIKSPVGKGVYDQLSQRISQGATPQDMSAGLMDQFEEKYGTKLQELEDWKKDQLAQEANEKMYSSLSEKYGDKFNRENVSKLMDELYSGDMDTLGDILHHAHLGRSATQSVVDTPSGAGAADSIPSGGGVTTIPTPETIPQTSDEALAMANADLGINAEDY